MPIEIPATRKASTGAITAGISTLPKSPSLITASTPAAATADPTIPPIRACEELDGSPKYQVARFQAIAPIKPAKTIVGVITSALTTSLATVAATLIEMKAPTKLSAAANPIATEGRAAPVEIEVATTLAVSWNPLVKSNASAVPTTMTRMTSDDMDDVRGRHEFLMTIPSRICAAVSVASIAFSSTANMSFQRITTIGSMPLEK